MSEVRKKRVTIHDFLSKKGKEKIVMLAVYDYPMTKIIDECGIDGILVGDSVIMNVYGFPNTLYATLNDIIRHTKAVANAKPRALIVADMPFMTYEVSKKEAVKNAAKLIKAGADAVKLEGGVEIVDKIEAIIKAGIPVMGHIGLTPQRILKFGGYKLMGRTAELGLKLIEDAKALEEVGVFSIVVELTTREVAREITNRVKVPTICIGSGPDCDGQILVLHDILGLSDLKLSFVKQYIDLRSIIKNVIQEYINDVKLGRFPGVEHFKTMSENEYRKLQELLRQKFS